MKINTAKSKSSVSLFSLHVPLFLLILLLIGIGTSAFVVSKRDEPKEITVNSVLGAEDESDENNEDENKHEDKEDDEKSSEDRDSEDENESNEDERSIKYTNTYQRTLNTRNSEKNEESDDDDALDKEETEDKSDNSDAEDELEDSEDEAVVSTITNADGTLTKTIKKTDGNKIETKIITYDTTGKVVSEQELNEEGEETEDKVELISTVTNPDGTITKTFKKVEDNETEFKALTYDANGTLIKKAELNSDGTVKEEEIVGKEEDNDDETEDDSNEFELVFKSNTNQAIDPALGKLIKAKIKQEVEVNSLLGGAVQKLELEVKTEQGKVKYEGVASSPEKLFGIFNIEISKDVVIDPITGKILSVNQSFWSKLIDFISF